MGTASPLFSIERILKTIREDLESDDTTTVDFIEFGEAAADVVASLREVDFLAYSAIFSDPSGNVGRPGESSADYLIKTKKALEVTLRQYKAMLASLSLE